MQFHFAAAIALIAPVSAFAQAAVPDLGTAKPIAGNWTYSPAADGSEAVFVDPNAHPQLTLHCSRATRQVSISKPASAATPTLDIWTSSQTRSVPATFSPATGRITANVQAGDTLFDAMVSSRGRIGVSVGVQPPLVVPPWPEIARVIEDCRA